jgi:hypothetical protein
MTANFDRETFVDRKARTANSTYQKAGFRALQTVLWVEKVQSSNEV